MVEPVRQKNWTNPVTNKGARINQGWDISLSHNDGEELYAFSSQNGEHAIFLFTVVNAQVEGITDIVKDVDDSFFQRVAGRVTDGKGWDFSQLNGVNVAEIKGKGVKNGHNTAIRAWISGGYLWESMTTSRAADAINADTAPVLNAVEMTTIP
ncbi:hypothetical protein LZK73_21395 [Neorhizobium galegae]|nr:hypothetical protein LZK73_21395 [Neorhizobium galegae]